MPSIVGLVNRSLRAVSRKREFDELTRADALHLDFDANKSAMSTIREILGAREYSDWFPFYENATVVDIGAHFGFFSMFAERNTGDGARIISVEPSSRNFKVLTGNIKSIGARKITALQGAVGRSDSVVQLALSASVNNTIVAATMSGTAVLGHENVTCMTLQSLLDSQKVDRVDFLKMDCEGAEYEIFDATPKAVLDRITTVSMEFHDLKSPIFNGNWLARKLWDSGFDIKKFDYSPTGIGKNYGKMIASKTIRAQRP